MIATVDVFELWRVICRKSPILTYPTCIWRLSWGDPVLPKPSATKNLKSLAIVWHCLLHPMLSHFSRIPTCDRQRDTHHIPC